MKKYSKVESSSALNSNKTLVPKPEILDFEFPSSTTYSTQLMDNVASSSQSNVRSFFIGMGFSPSLVDKVIKENGEDNVDLLLETLSECADVRKSKSESSDSLGSLFDEMDTSSPLESTVVQPKEELDVFGVDDNIRASLLKMNFTLNEVEFAMDKLGKDASVEEVVDFIIAAQMTENLDEGSDDVPNGGAGKNEEISNESLFGTMEKTLCLLGMGFSENEVSSAIEMLGSEVPVTELADSICAAQVGETYIKKEKYTPEDFSIKRPQVAADHRSFSLGIENNLGYPSHAAVRIKTEDFSQDGVSQSRDTNTREIHEGKRPNQEYIEDHPNAQFRHIGLGENYKGKRPKQECIDDSSPYVELIWVEEKFDPRTTRFGMPKALKCNSSKSLDRMVTKPPYFFYGNIENVSLDIWGKISQFLYSIEPEFVNTGFFSALSRKEGYLHNLPRENRFHIGPKPPMTIEDAIPNARKWWPSWDTRKQLNSISSETNGLSQLCDRLGSILVHSRGCLSSEQKRDILHHCQALNLMWVGPNELGPMGPEYLELILGYPVNHTEAAESSLMERLHSLKQCFQTDTLGYHLSVLKSMFPGGLTMLSLFSGIGGAEVALHRLGIHLKGLVSVETCETNRRILRRWWHNSGQTGQLEQIEDIQKLTTNKIERMVEKFGGFDFVICQKSFTRSMGLEGESAAPVFDFTTFYEFVRVLQLVRGSMERRM